MLYHSFHFKTHNFHSLDIGAVRPHSKWCWHADISEHLQNKLIDKRSIVRVLNVDNICMARALCIAKASEDDDKRLYDNIRRTKYPTYLNDNTEQTR